MATFNATVPLNQIIDIGLPGIPVPNTGVFYNPANAVAFSNPSIVQFIAGGANDYKIKAIAYGITTCSCSSHNASGSGIFNDTINLTCPNPAVEATGSGMTVSAPHA